MATFNFLEQFSNIEIDLSGILDEFNIELSNDQPVKATIKNIFEIVKFDHKTLFLNASFTEYEIEQNDLPEDIALKYYGNLDYWWLVLLSNNIVNPFTEWHLSDDQIYDIALFLSQNQNELSFDGYYNVLAEQNDNKRKIQLLKRDYLPRFLKELKSRIKIK